MTSPILSATESGQETSKASDDYVQATNGKMQRPPTSTIPLLSIDEEPGRREAVRQGQILVEPTQRTVPSKWRTDLSFDWTGAVFFPNTTIQRRILEVLNGFDPLDDSTIRP